MSKNKVRVKVLVKGERKVLEALKKALDGSFFENGSLALSFESDDVGDARAFLNSTLRVINASLNSIE